jgi:hypothetical protein
MDAMNSNARRECVAAAWGCAKRGWFEADHGGIEHSGQGLFLEAMARVDRGGAALVGHLRRREGAPVGDLGV